MKRRLTMILTFMLLSVGVAMAQTKVSGTVVEAENDEPIIGAVIKLKGQKSALAVTDIDGNFSFTTSQKNPSLEVSSIGFVTQTIKAGQNLVIKMVSDSRSIDEVVVTGMQKMDKRLFTGATAKVDAEKTKLDGVADVSRALEGRAAGVSVQNVSGTFGTAPKIRVRGATSIYGSSKPLWVIDGVIQEDAVEVSADDLSSGDAKTLISNAISGLSADDIESFQVLKDGSATSIYGARAMAGVVVVTTKRGKAGRSTINYTGEFTYRLKPSYRNYNISNSQEQMGIYKEMAAKGWLEFSALANGSTAGLYGKMYNLIAQYDETNGKYGLPYTDAAMNAYLQQAEFRNTDWFDLLFRDNIMQNHSVSISTGSDKANLYASISAISDPGWTMDSKVERYTANVNATFNLSKQLSEELHKSEAHNYAARYHAKEQQLIIQEQQAETRLYLGLGIAGIILAVLAIAFACYASYQKSVVTEKNRFLAKMINGVQVSKQSAPRSPQKFKENAEFFAIFDNYIRKERLYANQTLQRQDICDHFGIGRHSLNDLLSEHTDGLTFPQYINDIRVQEALILLQDSPERTLTDIAAEVGFTPANLREQFKRKYGMTPVEYRQNL